jgi:hypothetical protein
MNERPIKAVGPLLPELFHTPAIRERRAAKTAASQLTLNRFYCCVVGEEIRSFDQTAIEGRLGPGHDMKLRNSFVRVSARPDPKERSSISLKTWILMLFDLALESGQI